MNKVSRAGEKGIIGRAYENDKPVIYAFVNEMPPIEIIHNFEVLTVISWKYDGSQNNGMPDENENLEMIRLEDAIDDLEKNKYCVHAYNRTGNDLKELVYYIHNQKHFIDAINIALENHPRYPIEINFFNDPNWNDFHELMKDFS